MIATRCNVTYLINKTTAALVEASFSAAREGPFRNNLLKKRDSEIYGTVYFTLTARVHLLTRLP